MHIFHTRLQGNPAQEVDTGAAMLAELTGRRKQRSAVSLRKKKGNRPKSFRVSKGPDASGLHEAPEPRRSSLLGSPER